MSKEKLIRHLVTAEKKRGIPKKAVEEIVQSIFDHLVLTVQKKKKFSYPNFGVFVLRTRKKRVGRNPKTAQAVELPARKAILFRPFRKLKSSL